MGASDGNSVGIADGITVGLSVVLTVGFSVGLTVGAAVVATTHCTSNNNKVNDIIALIYRSGGDFQGLPPTCRILAAFRVSATCSNLVLKKQKKQWFGVLRGLLRTGHALGS